VVLCVRWRSRLAGCLPEEVGLTVGHGSVKYAARMNGAVVLFLTAWRSEHGGGVGGGG